MSAAHNRIGRARTAVRALAAALVGAALLLPPGTSMAQEPRIEFTVRPAHAHANDPRTNAWLIHRARPGAVVREEVAVANLGSERLDLLLYPADAISTEQGAFSLEPIEAADEGVAGWVSVERSELSLPPDTAIEVPVVIRVPENATPGDHPGAIVARTAEPIRRGNVPTLLAVGVRLYLRVPGEIRPGLSLHGIRAEVVDGRPRFTLDLENTGNSIVEVDGSYQLEGLFGLERGEGSIGHLTLVPGARVHPQVTHPDRLLGGDYSARFTLKYGGGRRVDGQVSFSAGIPWPLVALLLILGIGGAVVVRAVRSRRRRRAKPAVHDDGDVGDASRRVAAARTRVRA